MARPRKTGLDYFPFDVDFFSDEKIVCIGGEFGGKGELVAIRLLCAVYRNGYFVLWNDATRYKLMRDMPGVSESLLQQIVTSLAKRGFFDENLLSSANVLTSRGIQQRYFEAVKRRQSSSPDLPYLLVSVNNNPVNVNINSVSVDINPQSKVKKSKEKNNPSIIPPEKQGGVDAQSAEWGEEFLKTFFEATPPAVLDRRFRALEITRERFEDIARMVMKEWNDEGVRHQKFDGAARHLFNHVRKKLRLDPRLRAGPTTAELRRAEEQRKAERLQAEEEARRYRQSVAETGKTGWQQYCAARGLDPDKTDIRKIIESQNK